MLISHSYCMTIISQGRGLYLTQADRGFNHPALPSGTWCLFSCCFKEKVQEHFTLLFSAHVPERHVASAHNSLTRTSHTILPSCPGVGNPDFIRLGEEEKWVLVRMRQVCLEGAEKPKSGLGWEGTEHVCGPREGWERRKNLKGERRRVRKSKNE